LIFLRGIYGHAEMLENKRFFGKARAVYAGEKNDSAWGGGSPAPLRELIKNNRGVPGIDRDVR
jgi:hypothetical protein